MKALEYISYQEYLKTPHWRRIRWAALWIAGNRCQICRSEQDPEVHHNNYESLYHERPEDLVILCRHCHEIYETNNIVQAATIEGVGR